MTDYEQLVKALREAPDDWYDADLHRDSAAAIEALQAEVGQWKAAVKGQEDGIKVLQTEVKRLKKVMQTEVKRLKDVIDELREAQTYIDHHGDKWMTSAKDVPKSAYNHGYMDGKNEAEAAQPHWVSVEERLPEPHEYVLCRGKKGGCFVGWTLDNADVVKANGHGRAFVHGGNARTFTHWMPLPSAPQPPKEDADAE